MSDDHHYGRAVHTARHAWLETKAVYPIIGLVALASALSVTSMSKYLFASTHTVVNRHNMTEWFNKPNFVWPMSKAAAKPSITLNELPDAE